MQSWFKKAAKENRNKKRKQKITEKMITNSIFSIILLFPLLILFLYSIKNSSNEYGIILTIIFLIITYSFEIYEWIYVFKKDKSKKYELAPILFSFLIIILFVLVLKIFNVLKYIKWNNLICSGSLLLYIISITLRKNFIDIKAISKP